MSFDNFVRPAEGSTLPGWAARANEPLVSTVDASVVRKEVRSDLRAIQKSVDEIARLGRKKGVGSTHERVLALSEQVRARARVTSNKLREALGTVAEGSSDHNELTSLSEEFKAVLRTFQQHVEAQQRAVPVAPLSSVQVVSDEPSPRQALQQQLQQEETAATAGQISLVRNNEAVLLEREAGIEQIHRNVQDLAEIFQDIHSLVSEQGDHIDNIQTNIEAANNHQTRAVKELVSASRHQRRSKKLMCCSIVMVVLVTIILILVAKFAMNAF
mmetsp:Transcript_15200/g.25871  ORF Transcript_15200/g.25871 Transcript_15200/m.25871 type:complete len:272 (-) Transcript_15200:183-998(-)